LVSCWIRAEQQFLARVSGISLKVVNEKTRTEQDNKHHGYSARNVGEQELAFPHINVVIKISVALIS